MIQHYIETEITRLERLAVEQQQQIEALHRERIAVLGGIQAYRDVLAEMAKIDQAAQLAAEQAKAEHQAEQAEAEQQGTHEAWLRDLLEIGGRP